jgi:hypothetical protein
MMKVAKGAAIALILLAAAPAAAGPCTEEIARLDGQLQERARAAISTSTGSKEVAAARESRAVEARDRDVPVTAIPTAPAPGTPEASATAEAADAGAGGDRIMSAKATLNRARALDRDGDERGCNDALAEARRQLAE